VFETAALWIHLQESVDRLSLDARPFSQALRRAAGWGAEQQSKRPGVEDLEDRVDDRRLANAWARGDHERLRRQR
jgi:hypothetical protein